jgi:hypothetical protein
MNARQWFQTLYEVVLSDLRVLWLSTLVPLSVFYVIVAVAVAFRAPGTSRRGCGLS